MPTSFDSTLYDHLVNMSTSVDTIQTQCGSEFLLGDTQTLKNESNVVMKYTEFASKDTHASIILLDKNITELNNAYKKGVPSVAYCKLKLKIINEDLRNLLIAIGGKQK